MIWSNEHGGWWRPGRYGYAIDFRAAGRFTREEAIDICRNALGGWRGPSFPFPEIAVREADLLAWVTRWK